MGNEAIATHQDRYILGADAAVHVWTHRNQIHWIDC
jgi:hypothetical protein